MRIISAFHNAIITAICTLTAIAPAHAQTKQKVDIEHATVFLSGAELYSTARLNLPEGETEILFTNVGGNAAQQSLTIGADAGIVVQSAKFQNNYLSEAVVTPRAKELQDSIKNLSEGQSQVLFRINTVSQQIAILTENNRVAGANVGLSVAELQKLLDLVASRMTALQAEKHKLDVEQGNYSTILGRLSAQLNEETSKQVVSGGQLLVKFYTPRATSANIHMSYVVPNAGWTPTYDVRVDKLTEPVQLFYKANVFQNSGVKWDKVKLTLSTGNPNEGAEAPVLSPWYMAFTQPGYYNNSPVQNDAAAYQKRKASEISISGGRSNSPLYLVDDIQLSGAGNAEISNTSMNNYVQVDNSGINTSFDIDLSYSIPSDGKPQIVSVKRYDLPATYRHYAVPKLDHDAFLQARITNWADLNLLPAQTNIFYEGTYIGQGMIDPRSAKDTLNLSLGRDKKVIVRREIDKKLRSVKTIGSNVRETIAYTISVRNTRKEKVDITLFDQFPVSNDSAIEIESTEAEGATIEENTGIAQWGLSLDPNATRDLRISYTVKYPKGRVIK
jgi:uncharacterized protein (TIGR02231 family)